MTLASPSHIALGASAIEPMARFFQAFGFVRGEERPISAFAARELYGIPAAARETCLVMPGASAGFLRIIETPHPPLHHGPFELGSHAIDLYARDIEHVSMVALRAGAKVGPIAPYRVGGMEVKECKCVGPDGVALVLIQVDKRRPSILDSNPAAFASEVHSGVFVVDSADDAIPFWKQAGLRSLLDATFAEAAVAAFMGLPRPDTRLRLVLFADEGQFPIRLELIEFPDPDGRSQPSVPSVPLRPGRFAFGFHVKDVRTAANALNGATYSRATSIAGQTVVAGTAPGGVRFELWESEEA